MKITAHSNKHYYTNAVILLGKPNCGSRGGSLPDRRAPLRSPSPAIKITTHSNQRQLLGTATNKNYYAHVLILLGRLLHTATKFTIQMLHIATNLTTQMLHNATRPRGIARGPPARPKSSFEIAYTWYQDYSIAYSWYQNYCTQQQTLLHKCVDTTRETKVWIARGQPARPKSCSAIAYTWYENHMKITTHSNQRQLLHTATHKNYSTNALIPLGRPIAQGQPSRPKTSSAIAYTWYQNCIKITTHRNEPKLLHECYT